MKRLLAATLGSVLLLTAGGAIATPPGPGKHFDCSDAGGATSCASDDTGCVPGSKDDPSAPNVAATLKCADALAKAFSKAVKAVITCHKKQADAAFKAAPVDDEACEKGPNNGKSAKERLDAAIAKVAPLCTSTELTFASAEETTLFADKTNPLSLDAQNGNVYCDSTMGAMLIDASGDDAGWVPHTGDQLKCADSVGKELGKLTAAVIKCHIKMADQFFAGKDFDENVCEENDPVKHKSAVEKYNAAMTKLTTKGICSQPCLSPANRTALGANVLAQVEGANVLVYPCPTTTTTTTTTSTSTTSSTCPPPGMACSCSGGTPLQYKFKTVIGAGSCGHLASDTNANFFSLACSGLYFGGAGVAVPLPAAVPDNFFNVIHACCDGSTLTLTGTSSAEAGGNLCSGGSNHHNPCISNFDCPGGTCKFLHCTTAGCLFGPPLPIPNSAHMQAPSSTCGILTITATATGTADCSTGEAHTINLPLNDNLFLSGDQLANRCVGGTSPGAPCGNACGNLGACAGGGTCTNDTARCTGHGATCCSDADCGANGTCETGACVGGANNGKGCITDADCPSGFCKTFVQPCPICNSSTSKCNGGPNDGLACTPESLSPNGDFPTSHECPPPGGLAIGSLAIGFLLDTATLSKTAINAPDQSNVFCGFCKNKTTNSFARTCNGSPSGTACACQPGPPCNTCSGAPCLPVQCNPANMNADCATVTNFTSCGQRTSGAFTTADVARTIFETGSPATGVTTGGPPVASTLVSIFCIPPSYNILVDSAGDLPGPGAVALSGNAQLLP